MNVAAGARWPPRPPGFVPWAVAIVSVTLLLDPVATAKSGKASEKEAASNFKLQCSSCHGANGAGDTSVGKTLKAADLRSPEVQKQSDAELAQIISEGKGNMPSFKNSLNPDQIRALVAYIRKLAKSAK